MKRRIRPAGRKSGRSAERADLLLGHHALDVLGLALDAIARPSVGLDRQPAHDGIDASLLDAGAALGSLKLMMNVVIDRVAMRHFAFFPGEAGAFSHKGVALQHILAVGAPRHRHAAPAKSGEVRSICSLRLWL